ncbi:MAG TPA: phasin family protein [Actinocatenispora sp.]
MQQDAWRTYLELALGLTEKPRKRAKQVIDSLAQQSGASVDQLRSMTEDLVETSLANREAVSKLVRAELDRALTRVGLGNAEELAELRARVDELEQQVAEAAATTGAAPSAAKTAGTKKTAAKKVAAKKTAGAQPTAKKAAATKTAATKTAKKAAKKTAAKAATKKTAAKKTAATKSTGTRADG